MSSASDVPAFPLNLCGNTAKPEPFRPMGVSEEVRANYSGRIITRVTKAAALRRLRSAPPHAVGGEGCERFSAVLGGRFYYIGKILSYARARLTGSDLHHRLSGTSLLLS